MTPTSALRWLQTIETGYLLGTGPDAEKSPCFWQCLAFCWLEKTLRDCLMKGTPTPSHPWRAALAWRVQVGKYITYTRWFKVAFWFPSWRSHNLSKWSLNHPQKGRKELPGMDCLYLNRLLRSPVFWTPKFGANSWGRTPSSTAHEARRELRTLELRRF